MSSVQQGGTPTITIKASLTTEHSGAADKIPLELSSTFAVNMNSEEEQRKRTALWRGGVEERDIKSYRGQMCELRRDRRNWITSRAEFYRCHREVKLSGHSAPASLGPNRSTSRTWTTRIQGHPTNSGPRCCSWEVVVEGCSLPPPPTETF